MTATSRIAPTAQLVERVGPKWAMCPECPSTYLRQATSHSQYVRARSRIGDFPVTVNATRLQLARFDLAQNSLGIDADGSGDLTGAHMRRADRPSKVKVRHSPTASEVRDTSLHFTLIEHGHGDHDVGLPRVTLNLDAVFAVACGQICPEIAEVNSPLGNATIDRVAHHRPAIRRNAWELSPIHPQLLLSGYCEIRRTVDHDVKNTVIESDMKN
jgi:hypothetical protein